MRNDRQRLLDVLEAIGNIRKRLPATESEFLRDELVQVWVLHHLQVIGEAASRLSATVKEKSPTVPWAQIVGLRNVVVHQYFGVDLELVFATAQRLSELEANVEGLLGFQEP